MRIARLAASLLGCLMLEASAVASAQAGPATLQQTLVAAQKVLDDGSVPNAATWVVNAPSRHFDGVPWEVLPLESVPRLHARVRFYDAVLSDLEEATLNEEIAVAYERFTRHPDAGTAEARTERLRLESVYRDVVARRDAARAFQREARALLGIATGIPGVLPVEIEEPASEVLTPPQWPVRDSDAKLARNSPEAARRWYFALVLRDRASHESEAALLAARKRLEYAEAVQTLERERFEKPGGNALDLGAAMASVARAQFQTRRAEYRAMVYRAAAETLLGALP